MSGPVLILGATRGTGLIIATRLLEEGQDVRIIARSTAKARAAFGTSAEIVTADLTTPTAAFADAFRNVRDIVFTAGVPPGPAPEELLKNVEYEGVVASLIAATSQAFRGRFLYMTTIGTTHRSMAATALNLMRKNMMYWRRQADMAIRTSGVRWTIIRAGRLTNSPAGSRSVKVVPGDIPMHFRSQISRSDVADVFLEALVLPSTVGRDFSVVWTSNGRVIPVAEQLAGFTE